MLYNIKYILFISLFVWLIKTATSAEVRDGFYFDLEYPVEGEVVKCVNKVCRTLDGEVEYAAKSEEGLEIMNDSELDVYFNGDAETYPD